MTNHFENKTLNEIAKIIKKKEEDTKRKPNPEDLIDAVLRLNTMVEQGLRQRGPFGASTFNNQSVDIFSLDYRGVDPRIRFLGVIVVKSFESIKEETLDEFILKRVIEEVGPALSAVEEILFQISPSAKRRKIKEER